MSLALVALLLASAASLPAAGGAPGGEGENRAGARAAPSANAGPDQSAQVNQTVYFDGSNSSDPDGDPLTYSWDFDRGNGIQEDATGPRVSHAYTQPGTYHVTLTVSDGQLLDTDECQVTVTAPGTNAPPDAIISSPENGDIFMTGDRVRFDGSNSSDPDSPVLRYTWGFGDGDQDTGKVVYHVYRDPGLRIANLTVNDTKAQDRAYVWLNILPTPNPGNLNTPPNADAGANWSVLVNETIYFLSFSTDPQSDNLSYYWDWDRSDGVDFLRPDGEGKTCTTSYSRAGNYTVTHWVIESDTLAHYFDVDTCWVNVTEVALLPPLADAGPNQTVEVDKEVTLSGSGLARNPGGSIRLYEWDFESDGVWDWNSSTTGKARHTYTAVRDYVARFRVTDDHSLTAEDVTNVTVTPKPNMPPVASAGGDLTTFAGQVLTLHGTGSDEDGQVVLYQWDFESDGIWDYESPQSGTASHTYDTPGTYEALLRVKDDRGGTADDTTLITVVLNRPPAADAGGDQSVNCGEAVQFDGSASRDPEGQRLSFSWDFDDRDGIQAEASGPMVDHIYTRGGEYTATLTVTDELGESSKDTAIITVVQSAGVSLALDPRSASLDPGEREVFRLTVLNTGNGLDTFGLALSGDNYRWGSLDRAEVVLGAGESSVVSLEVVAPIDAPAGSQAKIKTRAVSALDPAAEAEAQLTATVNQLYSTSLYLDKTRLSVAAGGSGSFTVTVTNTGNGDDRVSLSATGATAKWVTFSPRESLLSKGASKSVSVRVQVPSGASAQSYLLTIMATSQNGASLSSASLNLTVKSAPEGAVPGPTAPLLMGAAPAAAALVWWLGRRRAWGA
ncbi:MAG: PKD domain-containing protein [Thermoplasmatota archaeon]